MSYCDPVVTIIPEPLSFGYESNIDKMHNLNYFDIFPSATTPSSSTPIATLAPTPPMVGLAVGSPSYAFGTPNSSTSESSNASSPDIQSLLPPRHSWSQLQVAASSPWHALPTPAPTIDSASSASPLAPWPLETDNTTTHALTRPQGSLLHLHAARHHPYLAEAALAGHAGSTVHHSHTSPNGETTNMPPLASLGGAGDERPKSGRLGVKRRQKYTRTRTGCLGCRARRIKCDEGRPICRRCTVAKRECVFPDPNEAKKSKKSWSQSDSEEDVEPAAAPRKTTAPSLSINTATSPVKQPASAPAADRLPSSSQHRDVQHETSSAIELGFDLAQAMPEGFGIDGEPFPWDRAFTDTHNLNNLGLDVVVPNVDLGPINPEQGDTKPSMEAQLLHAPNFLVPWFPTAQEQSLILHYCANAADLMMAIPQGLNPMLAINLPLALESPRGTNPAGDALRVTLLGIGAVHQAFLLARSGVRSVKTTASFQYAANLRDMAKMMVRKAVMEDPTAAASDAALSAATSLATIDIFFGGEGWQDNFNIAKRMVGARGGPSQMLKDASPTQLADDVTVTPARLLLEVLTIYESFGSLTLDEEPSLLSNKHTWWFEKTASAYEDKSVETLFGMSKVMVHLFSRVARLLARVSKLGQFLDGSTKSKSNAHTDGLVHIDSVGTGLLPASVIPVFRPLPQRHSSSSTPEADRAIDNTTLQAEAERLEDDIDAWLQSLQTSTVEHERVQVGNKAYAHAMKILLWRMVFGRPRSDADVQASAQQILQHCSVSTAALGMSIDLMWPAVIAGCEVDGNSRQWLMTLLEGFKAQCCFDVHTASRIIQEVWRRVDNNEARADWKGVCSDLGLKVLLC